MELAQHLLSPMSHHPGDDDGDRQSSEHLESSRQVTRILNFGTKTLKATAKPLSLVTASQTSSTVANKTKFKIPTKPDRVMAAPGTFLECGQLLPTNFVRFIRHLIVNCMVDVDRFSNFPLGSIG